MKYRPTEFLIRRAFSGDLLVLVLAIAYSNCNPSASSAQAPVTKAPVTKAVAFQPNGKFHVSSVPVRSGEDPWGPAKNLGVAGNESYPIPNDLLHVDLYRQSKQDEIDKSTSCVNCHSNVGNMHPPNTVAIGCVDCHGGNPNDFSKNGSHVHPRYPEMWSTSGNPVRSYALLNHESPEFVRFVNPGDLRVAHISG